MTDDLEFEIPEPGRVALPPPDTGDLAMQQKIARALFGVVESPKRIRHFEIVRKIGAGGMGAVFEAFDTRLRRKAALKRVQGEPSPTSQRRLFEEARSLARLSHPNVMGIHEVLEVDGNIYLAMEYIEGSTLAEWLGERPRRWREIVDVFVQAGRGLAAAHDQQIIHRDFKPSNVLVGSDGRVRVLDFGLAKAVSSSRRDPPEPFDPGVGSDPATRDEDTHPTGSLTRPGTRLGTIGYMAPEQSRGAEIDARADQYSFCVALGEALRGSGSAAPLWVRRVIERGLAFDPNDRWPSMDVLLAALVLSPRARRIRRALVLVAAALGASAWVSLEVHEARLTEECEARGREIDSAWNEDARARLRAGIEATGLPGAPGVADSLMPWIDEYAEAWRTSRVEVCRAANFGDADPELTNLEVACLRENQIHLEALLDVLAHPGDGDSKATLDMLQRSVLAVASLSPMERCRDEQRLRARPARPWNHSPVEFNRWVRVQADVSALEAAGRHDEGLQLVEEQLSGAEALDWAPIEASLLVSRGRLLGLLGHYDDAEATLREAYLMAFEAGDDETAFASAIELAVVVGDKGSRDEEGLLWSSLAEAILDRARISDSDLRRAQLAMSRGKVYARVSALDEASRQLNDARDRYTRVLGPSHPVLADILDELGANHAFASRFDEAEVALRSALEIKDGALGPKHPSRAVTLHNLTLLYNAKGEFAKAAEYGEEALLVYLETVGPDHIAVANELNALGASYTNFGEYEKALDHLARALSIYRRTLPENHHKIGDVYRYFGTAFYGMGKYPEAIRYLENALLIYDGPSPDHMLIAEATALIGAAHSELGEHDLALDYKQRAQQLRLQSLPEGHFLIGLGWAGIAVTYLDKGDPEKAIEFDRRAIEVLEAEFGPLGQYLAWPLTDLGSALVSLGRPREAIPVLERALEIRLAMPQADYFLANTRYRLATALWADPDERTRAHELARAALAGMSPLGEEFAADVAEIEEWLAAHPAS